MGVASSCGKTRGLRNLEWFLTLLDEESARARRLVDTGVDYDGDGLGNPDDPDDDNDGVADVRDAFPSNARRGTDTNGNGTGRQRGVPARGQASSAEPGPRRDFG